MIVRKVKRETFVEQAQSPSHFIKEISGESKSLETRIRGGSEKITSETANNATNNNDLFIIPEKNVYTVKGSMT